MEESTLLLSVHKQLTSNFHSGWIDALKWTDTPSSKSSMNNGLTLIRETQSLILVNFAKFALGGKHFIDKYETMNSIQNWCYEDVVVYAKNKYKAALQAEYREFIFDILDSVNLLHYHIEITKEIYSAEHKNNYLNAIKRKRPRYQQGRKVKLLETILDICWAEYRFSFSNSFIQSILQSKEELKDAIIGSSYDEKLVIEASINKVDLMLCKLARFSKDKQISYIYNFQQSTISLESAIKNAMDKFHTPFLQFIEPEKLSNKDIEDWQKDSWGKDVAMWKLVLLMRYYSKTTKNSIQIDKVIEIYNKHYQESIQETKI